MIRKLSWKYVWNSLTGFSKGRFICIHLSYIQIKTNNKCFALYGLFHEIQTMCDLINCLTNLSNYDMIFIIELDSFFLTIKTHNTSRHNMDVQNLNYLFQLVLLLHTFIVHHVNKPKSVSALVPYTIGVGNHI